MSKQGCRSTFTISDAAHKECRNFTRDNHEHGGNFAVNMQGKTMKNGKVVKNGEYNSIVLERGLIDWHSHPAVCTPTSCALGLPSANDLVNIILGCAHGSVAHLVYAKEGTYLIQLQPKTDAILKEDKEKMVKFTKLVRQYSDWLSSEFDTQKWTYKEYVHNWLVVTNNIGLKTRLFLGNEKPTIEMGYKCELCNCPTPIYKKIHVPPKYGKL